MNLTSALIVLGIVIVTLKFRNQLVAFFGKVPVVGGLVA
jgi:hypothetical protein